MPHEIQAVLAIECKNVSMSIRKKTIVQHASFSIAKGKIAGLLGPNGAGKSTLLRILTGMTQPTSGYVRLFGERTSVSTLSRLSFLPDRGKLPAWLTAREWLQFASDIYPDWDAERAEQLTGSLAIKLDTRISSLSRGEEARLQLLTCLARTTPLVILDEPFTGVDLLSREQIASTVVADLADGERTFLIATHDIKEMENLFDTIVLIGNGHIHAVDDVEGLRCAGKSVESRYREVFA
ncbi:UNVERIFIED_CONTAM: ABC-2 type transport system ATP-binding protein [Brevibacillus sp. OAP136]